MRKWFLGVLAMLAVACGGGSGPDGRGGAAGVAQRATVAVTMAEDSSEDMGGVYVTFSKVSLVPEDGGDPVVLFESMEGREVNFSALGNESLLFSVNDDIEAGTYSKLLVQVDGIRVVGGPCEDLDTVVQDDEIELVPEEAIEIAAGDKLVISLAMNSGQSVQIKVDGENEQCVFEPVVDVSVRLMSPPEEQDCPTSVSGVVSEILLTIGNDVIGFVLDLGESSDPQTVLLDEGTGMFGLNGLPTTPNTIRLDDELTAKGRLDEDGDMTADVIVAGEAITFSGVVLGPPERGVVRVQPDAGEAVVGETNVRLFDGTLILFDCQDATAQSLTKDAKVTVTGKVAADERSFLASEIEVDPVEIRGALTGCEEVEGGFEITVLPLGIAIEQTYFVADDVGIRLDGNGDIPKALLEELIACEPLPVRITLAEETDDGEGEGDGESDDAESDFRAATSVRVSAESIRGPVSRIAAGDRLVLVDESIITVLRTATILDLRDGESLGALEDIEPGDTIRVFGLRACEDDPDVDFHAFVVIVLDESDEPDRPEPVRFEGCGVGYWKNHTAAWPDGISPHDAFGDYFDDVFPGKSLLDVLWQGGGGVHSLGRHAVAALLNAAADDIQYRYTEREVVSMFNDAVDDGYVEWTKHKFEHNNELGCHDDDHRDDDDWDRDDHRDDDHDDDRDEDRDDDHRDRDDD